MLNKSIKYFANKDDPSTSRCGIRLFQKYMSLRPSNAPTDVFYLKPRPEGCFKSDCWYYIYSRAVGPSQTVKRLCNQAGVDGYFTNHSLCRTCATRLFQQGIEEQQINHECNWTP